MAGLITAGRLRHRNLLLPKGPENWSIEHRLIMATERLSGQKSGDWNKLLAQANDESLQPEGYENYLTECGDILREIHATLPTGKWITVQDARRCQSVPGAGLYVLDLLAVLECRWRSHKDSRYLFVQSVGLEFSDLPSDSELLAIRTTKPLTLTGIPLLKRLCDNDTFRIGSRPIQEEAEWTDLRWCEGKWKAVSEPSKYSEWTWNGKLLSAGFIKTEFKFKNGKPLFTKSNLDHWKAKLPRWYRAVGDHLDTARIEGEVVFRAAQIIQLAKLIAERMK